jgi:hypothetical protein
MIMLLVWLGGRIARPRSVRRAVPSHKAEFGEPRTMMTDKRDRRPLKQLQGLSHDGRELDEIDIVFQLRDARYASQK